MVIKMNLSSLTAAALAAALVAAASVLAFSAMPALLVWAAFIGWASYDHSGATLQAALRSSAALVFGVVMAWAVALVVAARILPSERAAGDRRRRWRSLIPDRSSVCNTDPQRRPATFYGFASTFAYLSSGARSIHDQRDDGARRPKRLACRFDLAAHRNRSGHGPRRRGENLLWGLGRNPSGGEARRGRDFPRRPLGAPKSVGRAMIESILASLVPVFLVMLLGFVAGLTKDIDNRDIGSLNALVMDFALPAALFTAMAQTPRDAMISQGPLALVLLLAMSVVFASTYFIQVCWFGTGRKESALLALTASGPNVGSAGLPVIVSVFSRSASVSVAVAVAVAAIAVTPASLVLLEAANGSKPALRTIIRGALMKPIVIAPVAGLLFSISGVLRPSSSTAR